jgi:hypothetical protein
VVLSAFVVAEWSKRSADAPPEFTFACVQPLIQSRANVARMVERDESFDAMLAKVRDAVGDRVEFAIYDVAVHAAAREQKDVVLATGDGFTEQFADELTRQLPITMTYRQPIFSGLLASLRDFVANRPLTAIWGRLALEQQSLVVHTNRIEPGKHEGAAAVLAGNRVTGGAARRR